MNRLNRVAAWVYRLAGKPAGAPSPFVCAIALGLKMEPLRIHTAALDGKTLYWDPMLSAARQRALVMREVARSALLQCGMDADEDECVKLAKLITSYAVRRSSLSLVSGACASLDESASPPTERLKPLRKGGKAAEHVRARDYR
jgi:hypothetical protein